MPLRAVEGDAEFLGDLAVRAAARDEVHDLALALGQVFAGACWPSHGVSVPRWSKAFPYPIRYITLRGLGVFLLLAAGFPPDGG